MSAERKYRKWVALILGVLLAFPVLAAGPVNPEPNPTRLISTFDGDTPQRRPRSNSSPSRVYRGGASYGGSRHYYSGHYYSGHHYRPYFYGYGPWGYGYPWGYGGGRLAVPYYYAGAPQAGAIDLNVHPKKAKVFLNGQFIGKAGKYDGFPQKLWLPRGEYELIFYLDGYETIRKKYQITPDITIKANLTMNSGETTSVEEMSQVIKDRAREREELRRKYSKDRPGIRDLPDSSNQGRPANQPQLRDLPPRVQVTVTPADAVLYLDGEFLGTARGIAKRGGEFTCEPGAHDLEVVRPGHKSHRHRFEAERGEVVELNIKLESEN